MEDHLSLSAVAEKLDVSVDTVQRMVERGVLKAINVNSSKKPKRVFYRIPASEIARFLSERAVA